MTQQEYQRRRQALLAQMQPGSAALIFAAPGGDGAAQTVNIRIARVATSGISPVLTNRKPCWY
ncbi:proline aminopeptidase II [Salmonella enterica subsp. arizonae]|uniref:Proline aminopeptidase II n=1 Tax=Salmonella enterica subsp. arizonae TaxID=59203 RepID=A0A379T6S1_SALER|nr:proline aminopeptidase II [Salmonella enterica subsp. arizonae]